MTFEREVGDMGATQKIAEFIVRTEFHSFPEEAVYLSKRLFLDCLGVALAAVEEPVVQKLTRLLKTQGGKKEAWVWGQGCSFLFSDRVDQRDDEPCVGFR